MTLRHGGVDDVELRLQPIVYVVIVLNRVTQMKNDWFERSHGVGHRSSQAASSSANSSSSTKQQLLGVGGGGGGDGGKRGRLGWGSNRLLEAGKRGGDSIPDSCLLACSAF